MAMALCTHAFFKGPHERKSPCLKQPYFCMAAVGIYLMTVDPQMSFLLTIIYMSLDRIVTYISTNKQFI